jgi:hypothetical protein
LSARSFALAGGIAVTAAFAAGRIASAQPTPVAPAAPSASIAPVAPVASVAPVAPQAEPSMATMHPRYWDAAPARLFAATTIDLGFLYLRPRLSLGYGKPFNLWAGVDMNPIATSTGLGAYAGLRLQIPWFDLRAGARGFYAFEHAFLAPKASYSTVDLIAGTGPPSRYVTLEAEMSGAIPAGPGSVLLVLTASAVQGAPAGYYVYEETLRVITDPPAIYRARTGYAVRLGSEGAAKVGVVGEVLDLPGRNAQVYRAGVVASFSIDDHLEAVGLLVIPVVSPDSIGIAGGDFGELGLRYRWATGQTVLP